MRWNYILTVFLVFGRFLICTSVDDNISNDALEDGSCSLMESVNQILNITATITAEIDATHFKENVVLKREYDFVIGKFH